MLFVTNQNLTECISKIKFFGYDTFQIKGILPNQFCEIMGCNIAPRMTLKLTKQLVIIYTKICVVNYYVYQNLGQGIKMLNGLSHVITDRNKLTRHCYYILKGHCPEYLLRQTWAKPYNIVTLLSILNTQIRKCFIQQNIKQKSSLSLYYKNIV